MESNYRNKEFEQYVKENADQYRMFPSEKVWKNIHGTLHTRRKWYGFGLALLLLSTVTAVTWVMVSYPVSDNKKVTTATPAAEVTASQSASSPVSSSDINTTELPFSSRPLISSHKAPVVALVGTTNRVAMQEQEEAVGQTVPLSAMNAAGMGKERFSAIVTSPKISSIASTNTLAIVTMPVSEKTETAGINDFSVNDPSGKMPVPDIATELSMQEQQEYPLTIESVTNTYQRKARKRINWQLYVTPTVSYRKLTVNKSLESVAAVNYPFALSSLSDVNSAVTHKPDLGVQVGLSGGYPITKNLRVRAGFQFNISRYDIKASLNNPVQAPFDLNDANGGIDPVRTWTYYRNSTGNKSDWLKNYYFSVSFPIGIEMNVLGNDKTKIGIAGTIQPTYTIKDRAYLLSTDFKNYATVPWLMRHVNVSTGFEAFVNYSSGATRWQIGPQVRYQILSSFHNKYPVKENLFDFGVKVGVSLNQ